MNIMQLCLGPGLGGLELYTYNASVRLSETDRVFPVISQHGRLAERFKNSGLPVFYMEKGSKALPLIRAMRLARYIDKHDIDVVHMHWNRDLSVIALAKWLSRKKPRLVYTRHMQITRSKKDFYHRFLYSQVDVFVSITDVLANMAKKLLSEEEKHKIVTLYHGVPVPEKILSDNEKQHLRQEMGFDKDSFTVGVFSRIEEYKGQHLLVEALVRLKERGQAFNLLIVGHTMDQAYLDSLKQKVKQHALEQQVCFKGFVDNPQELMQACDVMALTTKEETFGLVLVEAMQAGIAVIGTNSGGVPEIIEHEKTGLMFDYDNVDSLVECLMSLKNDPERREQYAKAGQQKARAIFSMDQHYAALRRLLAGE